MKITSKVPKDCTPNHIHRLINHAVTLLEIRNVDLLEVVSILVSSKGTCIICKTPGSTHNQMLFATLTRMSGIYNSIWTPAICLDLDACKYKEAVQTR